MNEDLFPIDHGDFPASHVSFEIVLIIYIYIFIHTHTPTSGSNNIMISRAMISNDHSQVIMKGMDIKDLLLDASATQSKKQINVRVCIVYTGGGWTFKHFSILAVPTLIEFSTSRILYQIDSRIMSFETHTRSQHRISSGDRTEP